jgi:hypothetical protein
VVWYGVVHGICYIMLGCYGVSVLGWCNDVRCSGVGCNGIMSLRC